MKIVRIIARLNVGGPAKHVTWLTAGLQDANYRSLLVAGSVPPGEEDMGYFADEAGVKPVYIPEMSREISLKDAVTVWKLFRLFLRERPDVVHTHTAKAGTVGRVAGFFYRWLTPGTLVGRPRSCKFVHTYHGHVFHSYYGRSRTRLFLAIERLLARLVTDQLIVVSEQQGAEIGTDFRVGRPGQIKVVPLGLDLSAFADHASRRARFRDELAVDDETVLVGIVGRLTEIKNHRMFLNSVARLKDRGPKMRFVVIGDGSLRESLEQQARSLGLQSEVIFTGGRRDPEYFYPALDIVALTSLNEGTPLTLIEAMANARPVVATSVGGVVDLIGEDRGIGVPSGDEEAFASALQRLAADGELQKDLGARGLEFVQRNYRKERLVEDIKRLYRELMISEISVSMECQGTRINEQ
ncbi:MAG TPA: glycosyltransferase [Pyrinomonadaceae bacterium]|jgi:glycosyltransferase involved in cell wall biosynthesis|nr:glycosyltransferase [Pyrinomonadaceae bacterium]